MDVFQLGTVGRPAPAGKKERSGRSPDRASDVFSTEMKHTQKGSWKLELDGWSLGIPVVWVMSGGTQANS